MAKQFGGFTPEQLGKIDPAMAGMQADEQVKYMAANPGVSSRVGNMAQQAKKRISMANGGVVRAAEGTDITSGMGNYSTADMVPQYDDAGNIIGYGPSSSTSDNLPGGDLVGGPYLPPGETFPGARSQPAYDPTTGLPTAPTGVDELGFKPFLEQIAGGSTGAGAEVNIPGITEMLSSGNVPEDPTDYEITGSKRNWTITYADGTTLKSPYNRLESITAEAANIAKVLNEYKESDPYKAYGAAKAQYQTNIDAYKTYYGAEAEKETADPSKSLDEQTKALGSAQNLLKTYSNQIANMDIDDPQRATIQGFIDEQQLKVTQATAGVAQAQKLATDTARADRTARNEAFAKDPTSFVTDAKKVEVSDEAVARGEIASGIGDSGDAINATLTDVIKEGDVVSPVVKDAATYSAEQTAADVQATLDKLVAETGKPSDEALAEAQTMDASELSALGLTVEQIEQAVTVQAPDARKMEEGEKVEGPTVDMDRLESEVLNFEAVTGAPSSDATVQGQLTGLMADFEGGKPPAWAAGAMRVATAAMAARGLAASSMAGQAIVQAAMESALPIALADAATVAAFEKQNLSNRQQVAILGAEQRAKFLGVEFDQAFQTRVENAAKITDIANRNFDAGTQIALENARIASTVQIANLDAKNAKILSDAAAMTNLELTNLNNRQAAAVQQAGAFLQMEMTNLSNKQQVAIFKSQGNIQSILSDAAALNASQQFNASSENQTNQFYDNLVTQVAEFNVEQGNTMERFTVEQENAIKTFNVSQENARSEFNASQSLIIEQSNAVWNQSIVTAENAAAVAASAASAAAANAATASAQAASAQASRDSASFAFQTANNNADRVTQIAVQTLALEADKSAAGAAKAAASATAIGTVIGAIITAG